MILLPIYVNVAYIDIKKGIPNTHVLMDITLLCSTVNRDRICSYPATLPFVEPLYFLFCISVINASSVVEDISALDKFMVN